jgi:Tfp pilus assembly protein PilN
VRAVNLLPGDDAAARKAPPLPILVLCIGSVVVAGLMAVLFLSASSGVAAKQRALRDAQAQYAAIPAPAAPSPLVKQLPKQRQARVTALTTVLGQRVAWDRLLHEVSQVVPSDVWLVTLNALAPSLTPPPAAGAAATPSQGFQVTGCTYSQDSVARFLARLAIVPDLAGMTLGKSVASDSSGGAGGGAGGGGCPAGMLTFTLQGSVKPGSPS